MRPVARNAVRALGEFPRRRESVRGAAGIAHAKGHICASNREAAERNGCCNPCFQEAFRMRSALVAGIAVVVLAAVTSTNAQGPRQGLPPLVPESLVGSVSFDLYCASCHGRNGRGD